MSTRDNVISVIDTINLLLDKRPECYPLERVERFGQLFSWIMNPDDPQQSAVMGRLATARALRHVLRSPSDGLELNGFTFEEAYLHHFAPHAVLAQALWPKDNFDARGAFLTSWFRSQISTQVARFLLQDEEHPETRGRKPSLNRAIHFIENDGYGFYGDFEDHQKATSRKSIRDEWSTTRQTSPFLLALWILADEGEFSRELSALSPTYPTFLAGYRELMRANTLSEFFQVALFVRNRLEVILGSVEASIELPSFPSWLEPLPISFEPFNTAQQKLRHNYKAPALV